MGKSKFSFVAKGNFIQGQFQKPSEVNGEWTGRSPADFSDELGKFHYSYSSINDAVQTSKTAFKDWRSKSFQERSQFIRNYQSILARREEELSEVIAREVGRPLWEAKEEMALIVAQIDVILSESLRFVSDFKNQGKEFSEVCRYRPLGVMAVISAFNASGQLPHAHILPALLTGNTVVFKPSEKSPLLGQLMAECFQQADFPAGVFNLIQGEKEVGRRLCVHEGVNGILFTGSYEVGARIKQDILQQHWKLLVLEMGGKNPAIVWDDAQIDVALCETLTGAFLTSGQRCTSTSRIIVQNKILDSFVSRFHERAKAFSIGHPLDNPFMGPLIEQGSVDRYMKFLGIASREGFEVMMRGKSLDLPTRGNYVTPSICVARSLSVEQARKSIYQQTELSAPNVAIMGVDEIDEAIALANATQYGLVASVFTQSQKIFDRCWDSLEMGLVNWNKSTLAMSARLPFGGLKKSGNYFPTALVAASYCMYPLASIEIPQPPFELPKIPGLNWS